MPDYGRLMIENSWAAMRCAHGLEGANPEIGGKVAIWPWDTKTLQPQL